jgi:hypothetical protein
METIMSQQKPIGIVVTRSREDEIQEFVEYMASFYSPEHPSCLYPYELPDGTPLTKAVIEGVTVYYIGWLPVIEQDFQGDSLDRERVRDLLIAQGYSEVEK